VDFFSEYGCFNKEHILVYAIGVYVASTYKKDKEEVTDLFSPVEDSGAGCPPSPR
jgi:hypothetical protein